MKRITSIQSIATATLLGASALLWSHTAAAQTNRPSIDAAAATGSEQSQATSASRMSSWNNAHRASKIIGIEVRNRRGEKIGDIKDLVVDNDGRILMAVVSTGGFLGMGDRLHAVPWSAFQTGAQDNERILDIDKARLKTAPGFSSGSWPDLSDPSWRDSNNRFFTP